MSPEILYFLMLAALVGWPTIQLGAVLLRRRRAQRFAALVSELEADPLWNVEERDASHAWLPPHGRPLAIGFSRFSCSLPAL
jgi:hypothetical protein